jgi:hypothetical protein
MRWQISSKVRRVWIGAKTGDGGKADMGVDDARGKTGRSEAYMRKLQG